MIEWHSEASGMGAWGLHAECGIVSGFAEEMVARAWIVA